MASGSSGKGGGGKTKKQELKQEDHPRHTNLGTHQWTPHFKAQ